MLERRERRRVRAIGHLGQFVVPRCSLTLIVLFYSCIFSTILFLVWVIGDFGIADRVVATISCIPLIIAAAVKTVVVCGERRKEE